MLLLPLLLLTQRSLLPIKRALRNKEKEKRKTKAKKSTENYIFNSI